MAKNDYISDDLITMRDRLRESTAALREAAEQKRAENTPGAAAPAPAPATDERVDRRLADGIRAKQDLAVRLARDGARIEKLIAGLDARRAELQQAKDALAGLSAALDALSPLDPGGRFAADTDRLRLEYFRLCGTLDALAPQGEKENASEHARIDRELAAKTQTAAWIVGLAILAAAGIVAGVIAAVFH